MKLKKEYYRKTYYGSKKIVLDENTSQKDLKLIMKETKNNFKGIEVDTKETEKESD